MTDSLSCKVGFADRVGQTFENSPQISVLSESAEHLRERDGLDEVRCDWH